MRIDVKDIVGARLASHCDCDELEDPIRPTTDAERTAVLEDIRSVTSRSAHVRAGRHRLGDWASGWAENLHDFTASGDVDKLFPRYFGKYPELRLGNRLFIDSGVRAEVQLLRLLQTAVLSFARANTLIHSVAEFGAGTGHNLLNFARDPALVSLRGFEWSWSGVHCIEEIGRRIDGRVSGAFFDYFAPEISRKTDLSETCAVTVASLEQIGGDYRAFLSYLRSAKPALVVNIEPMQELMGAHELGELSAEYAQKRGYLEGYRDYLRNLQQAGMIEILLEQESLIGSKYINGYGVLIWRWIY